MKVAVHDIEALALGGAFLATGGGGDTLTGEILAEAAIAKHGPVDLIPLEDVADDALIVAIGGVGSPTVMQEKPSNGREAMMALDALETHLGQQTDALIAFEAGGVNGLLPLCVAATRGLPVVDADGMGRAFPEIQMESFSIYGVSPTPLAAASEMGDLLVLENARTSELCERLLRHFTVEAGGGQCVSAEHTMSGAQARAVSIPGTISLCLEIGRLLSTYANDLDGLERALSALFAPTHYGALRRLEQGKVVDMSRRVEGGYDVGELRLAPFDAHRGDMTISIKNEYLMAMQDDRPVALTPDLIILLDAETGRPITAETVRYGQRASVFAIGAPERMRTPRALKVVAPRNFGFDIDYVPLEQLHDG